MTAPGGGGRVLAETTRFETVRRLRWTPQRFAAGLYVPFVFACYHGGSIGWVTDAGLALLAFTLYAGFGVDRALAYDQLVTSNWVGPWRYIVAKLLSLSLALLLATALVGATVLAASSGAWDHAVWHSLLFLLLGAYFLPIVLFVEQGMESRLPMVGAIPLVGIAAAVVALAAGPGAVAVWLLGAVPRAYRLETLGPLAGRALSVSLPLALGLLFLVRRRVAGPAR